MKYEPTIGLEIHAELKTKTKMFCRCLNDPNEKRPNVNVCPVCMAHPGTLPVINEEAVKKVLMTGKALNGNLADYSRFDRKNYFYPDLPKGYQISQYKYPLVSGGELKGVKITRIHLEEDTGRLIHSHGRVRIAEGRRPEARYSYADFNRAGVPLMELVTEPDIKIGEGARKFAEELQMVLRYLDVSDADMEKGGMRVEANISLAPIAGKSGSLKTDIKGNLTEPDISGSGLGTKVEIKNLNSFKAVERAINYEIERQARILDNGKKVIQETRGWNEDKGETFPQREKEESHDYRYFPEPDLPSLQISNLSSKGGSASGGKSQISNLPELPEEKRERFKKEYNLKDEQIEIFIINKKLADYFEEVASQLKTLDVGLAANYLITDLAGDLRINPKDFSELIKKIAKREITSRVAKDVLKIMAETGKSPIVIISEQGLGQISGEKDINDLADKIIKENLKVAEEYKKGKETVLQFLKGQGMKITKGSVNPELLEKALKQKLK